MQVRLHLTLLQYRLETDHSASLNFNLYIGTTGHKSYLYSHSLDVPGLRSKTGPCRP